MSEGIYYVTPYAAALQWAGQALSDAAFKTFMMEFSHVDKYGCCFAGFRRLAELGQHDLTCIYYEMQEIIAHGLVKLIEDAKRDRFGRWTPALYQINPYFLYLKPDDFDVALSMWDSVEQTIEQKVPVSGLYSKVSIEAAEAAPTESTNNKRHQETPENSSSSRTFPESEMQNAGEVAKWQRGKQSEAKSKQREAQPTRTDVPPPPREKYPDITPVPRALSMTHEEELAIRIAGGIDMALRLVRGLIAMYGYNAVATAYNDPFVNEANKPAGALRSILQKQQRIDSMEVSTDEQLASYEQTHAERAEQWQRDNTFVQSEIEI